MKFPIFFECMGPWASSYSKSLASYFLFLNITNNEKAVKKGLKYLDGESEDYDNLNPPQRYQKYTVNLSINTLAHKIYNKLDKDKFTKFLKSEASGSTIKEKLFQEFHKKRYDFNTKDLFEDPKKLFDDIANAFIEIIKEAAEEYENSPRNKPKKTEPNADESVTLSVPNKTMSDNNSSNTQTISTISNSFSKISKHDIEVIQELLINISLAVDTLSDLGEQIGQINYKFGYNNAKFERPELFVKFNSQYELFLNLCNKAKFFNRKYEYLLTKLPKPLSKDSFIVVYNKYGEIDNLNSSLFDFRIALTLLSSELDEYDSK